MTLEQSFFKRILFDSPDCVKVLDYDARLLQMNDNGRVALCIRNFSDVEGTDWRSFWSGGDRTAADGAVELARSGGVGHFVGRFDVEGDERWWDVTITAMPGEPVSDRLLAVSRDVTSSRLADANEARMRNEMERRLRAVNEAAALLTASLDFDVTLATLAGIATDSFATFCVVEAIDGFGRHHSVVRSRRPETTASFAALRTAVELGRLTSISDRIMAGSEDHLERRVSGEWLAAVETSGAVTRALADLHVSAMLAVPIVHDGNTSGVLSLFVDDEDHSTGVGTRFGPVGQLFAKELGRRAGSALANASTYGRERTIAMRMQESALPTIIPQIDHLSLTAAYRPSSAEATIGGDWFDAFQLKDGRVAMTIGDVGGHGLTAALTMTKLRQAMRVASITQPYASALIAIADETLRMDGDESFATASAAIYNPADHTIEIAGAGHPGPYVRHTDGRIEDLTSGAPMLGVGHHYTKTQTVACSPGAVIAFFTDGLIEFDRDLDRGFTRFEGALASLDAPEGGNLAAALTDSIISDQATPDDIAVLVGYIRQPDQPRGIAADRAVEFDNDHRS